ncbi:MAG TPA: SGNH/GDSL hydrolase family protein [Terriglobales bacterium]|nr:SGNH/GDSL hydrolase family protein [Terriglobales bacterium]
MARGYVRISALFENDEDPRAYADGYHHAKWTHGFFREYNDSAVRWSPYVYWVGAEYKGQYVNINSSGIRRTWHRPEPADYRCGHRARIFMFGGSTMWGVGARDGYTIPSWLQRMLSERHACGEVTNFGQDGYVSTQEVLTLANLLRAGDVPDIVVFYDGYNDTLTAAINREPGLTYDEYSRRLEFNTNNFFRPVHERVLIKQLLWRISMSSGLGQIASRTVARMAPESYMIIEGTLVQRGGTRAEAGDDKQLEAAAAQYYLANVRTVEAMARQFGFRALFYWQPCIIDKKHLTAYEQEQAKAIPRFWRSFIVGVHQKVGQAAQSNNIHDISSLFADTTEPYFIDQAHVTEDGNRIIAKQMLDEVVKTLAKRK